MLAPTTTTTGRGRLLRVLGIGFGVAVTVGITIGGGILRTPGEIASHLPHPLWFLSVWVVGAVYALLGAWQLGELGAMLPRSGGQYQFARHALGDYAGFVVGWSDWLSTCGTTAAVSLLAAEFGTGFVPAWRLGPVPLAVALMAVFAVAQWRGIRGGSAVQNVTSLLKALMFAAVIVAALAWTGEWPRAAGVPVPPAPLLATGFLLSLQSVIYTYDGWGSVVYFSEELRDPGRDIPRAMIAGILAIGATYLLFNLALLRVLPMDALAGDPFAAATLVDTLFGTYGATAFRLLAVVSLLSAINGNHLSSSRVLFAMSRDGLFAARAAAANAGGTPTIALLLGTLAALLFILFGQTFEQVITILSFFFVANYSLSFLSVFVLRRREPARARPYRAWGYPWTTAAALAGSVLFLLAAIAGDTRNSVYALLLLAASYPVFRVMRR